ncbi:MAG: pyridoxamine 5'-phosphate oxidase family protein [Senegalia sp. (in: firmicutes)]|uniref:pyridoxamine 5'-phosphate oxidase family protein n=2 Tax=Senegalia sp. (in: firmicutes) TaxID=1924098 RepID=UPI003F9BC0AC
MRRKDREMDREFGLKVIDKTQYGIVSMIDEDGFPYGLPLSIVRDKNTLYFHSAKEGKKVDIFKDNPKVSIAFIGNVLVPENYTKDELDEIIKDEKKIGLLISKVFTTQFESAIARGNVKLIEDKEEQIKAMEIICKKYTPTKMDYFNAAIEAGLKRTNIYKVEIENLTAKRKKYDENGEEMK